MISQLIQKLFGAAAVSCIVAAQCAAQTPDTAKMLQSAASGSGQDRYIAIDDLGENHRDAAKAVPVLEKLLSDKDAQVRWRSARALGDYGDQAKSGAPGLRKQLADADPIVQYHAVVALGKVGDISDETVQSLVKAATHKDARIARAAIAALRHLKPGPKRVMAALVAQLKSDDDAVVLYALEAIVEAGAESVPLLNEALMDPSTVLLACAAIEQIGPPAAGTVPGLTNVLKDTKHSKLLIQALLAIASIGPAAKDAAPQIIPLLDSATDKTIPVAAAYALGAIGAEGADAGLKAAAAKDDPFLQMVATWALAKTHPEDNAAVKTAVDKLTAGLANADANIRAAAAKGLQMLQAPPEIVAPALLAVADDPDPTVSAHVVSALAGLGESIVPKASLALQKPEQRELAVRVLTAMGPKAAGAVNALVETMANADASFRSQVQFALAAIGPAAAPATEELAASISSDDDRVRESALYALRQIGPGAKSAVAPLSAKAAANDSFASKAAAWALARIEPTADVAAKAMPALSAGLKDADAQIQLESIDAIAAFGPSAKGAAGELQKIAAEDEDAMVRDAAKQALAKVSK